MQIQTSSVTDETEVLALTKRKDNLLFQKMDELKLEMQSLTSQVSTERSEEETARLELESELQRELQL